MIDTIQSCYSVMRKHIQLSGSDAEVEAAHKKLELFAKDTGLQGIGEAAVKLILINVDIATAQNYQQNNNCIWDLYDLKIEGEKEFGCPIKRQFPQYREPANLQQLVDFCKVCPRRSLAKDVFKFEKRLKDGKDIEPANPQPDKVAIINKELAKDMAALQPSIAAANKVISARPFNNDTNMPGWQCDSCGQQFYNDSSAVQLTKDANAHIKIHGRAFMTGNERHQISNAFRIFRQIQLKKEAA